MNDELDRDEATKIFGKDFIDKFERADFIAVNGDPARDDETLFQAEIETGQGRKSLVGFCYQSNAEIEAQPDIDDLSNLDWTVEWFEEWW